MISKRILLKLMNNAVYEKNDGEQEKRAAYRISFRPRTLQKLLLKVNFKRRKIFSEDLVALSFDKRKIFAYRPRYIGMSVLDLSKTLMYDFQHNVMKKIWKRRFFIKIHIF
ncbi:unnamed protein product [Ixodes hexagonus]